MPPRQLRVPCSLCPHPWCPALVGHFLLFHMISPVFLARLLPTFHARSFQLRFPTSTSTPGFLQWCPSIFCTPSPHPPSFSLGCFSPPVYTTSTNKAQDPFFSPFGVQEVNGTEHNSLELCQEIPRRAVPETSCSVHAAIDWSTVSTDRKTKEFSCQTYKPLPCVCKLQFSKGL